MKRLTAWIPILLLCIIWSPQLAFAQTAGTGTQLPGTTSLKDYQRVLFLLSSIHGLPAKAVFEETPEVELLLFKIADGPDRLERSRAVIALGKYWPDAKSFQLLAGIVSDQGVSIGLRIRTLTVLSESFREKALPVLGPLTKSENRQVQKAAIVAIAMGDTPEGRELLVRLREETDDRFVQGIIDDASPAIRFESAYEQAGD